MAAIDPIYRNLIQFVPEQPECSRVKTIIEKGSNNFSGQDAKSFYESVIGSCDSSTPMSKLHNAPQNSLDETVKTESKCKLKKTRKSRKGNKSTREITTTNSPASKSPSNESKGNKVENPSNFPKMLTCSDLKHFSFLKAAQFGDLSKVCQLLAQGANLNYQDFYGWTALMCAAKEGHSHVVQYLLDHGADFQITNNKGLKASCLASSAGHINLAYSISSYKPSVSGALMDEEDGSIDRFYCSTCKDNFLESEKNAHFTSTVHLFNSGYKHQHPAYLLPETNRGFQMLLRTGWQVDRGLGPEGKGIKYPVKTILKRDREGLGNNSGIKKAKITHFSPCDETAVSTDASFSKRYISARKSAQYALRSKEKRQKRKEINFRLEFNDM